MTVVPVPPVRPVRVVRPASPTPPIALRPAVQSGPGGDADIGVDNRRAETAPPSQSGRPSGSGSASPAQSQSQSQSPEEIEVIHVVGWPDQVIDKLGYDPRSLYVETFWLGILGPTCTWLMRRLAAGLDEDPAGFDLDLADTARALGLGGRSGRHSPFRRALARCVTFEVARREGPTTLAVRRRLPPLPRRHLLRLPPTLQEKHTHWMIPSGSSPVLEDAVETPGAWPSACWRRVKGEPKWSSNSSDGGCTRHSPTKPPNGLGPFGPMKPRVSAPFGPVAPPDLGDRASLRTGSHGVVRLHSPVVVADVLSMGPVSRSRCTHSPPSLRFTPASHVGNNAFTGTPYSVSVATFLLRVELPDRPGALGAVASRIGAVRGDLVAVEVVEHRQGKAVDEFVIELADEDHLSLLLSEVAEVDGVSVQDVRPVTGRRHDRRLEAYGTALIILKERTPHGVLTALASRVCAELDATWSAVLDVEGLSVIASHGRPPATPWLATSLAEARAAGNDDSTEDDDSTGDDDSTTDREGDSAGDDEGAQSRIRRGAPESGDIGFVDLAAWDPVLAAGRPGWRFGVRERAHLAALAQLADARWADMTERDARITHPSRAC